MYPKKIGPYPAAEDLPPLSELLHGLTVTAQQQLLQALIRIQQQCGWIAPHYCETLSELSGTPLSEIHGIIDFYHLLESNPATPWQIHVSTNITDMMLGQQANLNTFNRFASMHPELLSVIPTSCTGLCEQGPAILINGWAMGDISPCRAEEILAKILKGIELRFWPEHWFMIADNIQHTGPLLNHTFTPGRPLEKVRQVGSTDFIQALRNSGLKGRGGAGFPTASKWQACMDAQGENKVVVCNADEGEPGTFKDRVLLNRYIENILEGMSICAAVIGATNGYIYLRKEYLFLHQHISQAIEQRRRQQLLSEAFDIELLMGAGAYICGEESAMLDSMEGKQGIPRIRPPFPVEHGFLGRPTVVNNVETFCNITLLADKGLEAFTSIGPEGAPGSKLHSISGDCDKPGIYEFPLGTCIRDILDACGASDAHMVQVGGAAGQLVGRERFDIAIDYLRLHSAGSLMVFGAERRPEQLLYNFSHFFADESCGFCTPCRGGTQMLAHYSQQVDDGTITPANKTIMRETCELMMRASHCGLGKTAGHSMKQIIDDYIITTDDTLKVAAHD